MLLETIELNEQGPSPLVVLHGLFGAKENWRSQGLAWANDRRVVMMDLRNHGLSKHDKHMDYALMSEDVISTMDQLGLNKVDILGHSMGGKVAMYLSLVWPHLVNQLIVVDIPPARSSGTPIDYVHAMQKVHGLRNNERRRVVS